MQAPTLVLRDIHTPPAPPWWPPAPGWWLLAAVVLMMIALGLWWRARRRRRRRALAAVFDQAVAAAPTPADEVAAISELLRRALRRLDPTADHLQGEAWLALLDRESGGARKPARRKRGFALKPSPSRGRSDAFARHRLAHREAPDSGAGWPDGLGGDGVDVRERPQQQRQTHPHRNRSGPQAQLEGVHQAASQWLASDLPHPLEGEGAKTHAAAPTGDFAHGPGRLLLDGGYRRDTDPQQVAALRTLARARFLQWMARK